ncbi:MAG: adenylate/guanylate cyclase domain-containing protein [Actinomycetota bacterium]
MTASSTFGYAKTDDGIYLGYRVDGDGPIDVVSQSDWPGNIDLEWDDPVSGDWLRELRSFSRVITHDPRGLGLSSRNVSLPTLETRVSDLMTVLNTIGVRRPVLFGVLATGAVNILAAATRPRLPRALVWVEPAPRYARAEGFPWGVTPEDLQSELDFIDLWGTEAYGKAFLQDQEVLGNIMPPELGAYMPKWTRGACTPDVARELVQIWAEIDVRNVLDAVRTPTLLLVHKERKDAVDTAEYVAARMPAAEVRAMPGDAWDSEDFPAWIEQIRDFIGVERPSAADSTVLATVLFTDIVGSTQRSSEIGGRAWKQLLQRHHAIVRDSLHRLDGTEVDTAGDGFYATFDGPARGIQCALDIVERVRGLGIEIRAGIHTGECEVIDGNAGGLAVSIGARVAANAGPSEVLVSQTVRDLVAGSGLTFEDAGEHELKGVPDRWHLYRVVGHTA